MTEEWTPDQEEWTLDQLVTRVAEALAADGVRAPNGRVREVPDARALRWYATIGLLDRPSAFRGRTALYGHRHLLQAVAVKRRQAEGLALAQIQAELSGATDAMLYRVARLPARLLADAPPPVAGRRMLGNRAGGATPGGAVTGGAVTGGAVAGGATSPGGEESPTPPGRRPSAAELAEVRSPRSPFWRAAPASMSAVRSAEAEPVGSEPVGSEPVGSEPDHAEPVHAEPVHAEPVQAEPVHAEPVQAEPVHTEPVQAEPVHTEPVHAEPSAVAASQVRPVPAGVEPRHLIRLGPGATLVLTAAPSAADVADLRAAAAPLIRLLADRALLTAEESRHDDH